MAFVTSCTLHVFMITNFSPLRKQVRQTITCNLIVLVLIYFITLLLLKISIMNQFFLKISSYMYMYMYMYVNYIYSETCTWVFLLVDISCFQMVWSEPGLFSMYMYACCFQEFLNSHCHTVVVGRPCKHCAPSVSPSWMDQRVSGGPYCGF